MGKLPKLNITTAPHIPHPQKPLFSSHVTWLDIVCWWSSFLDANKFIVDSTSGWKHSFWSTCCLGDQVTFRFHSDLLKMATGEDSQHLAMLPAVSVPNDIWETSTEIPYWWRITTQIWKCFWLVVPHVKFDSTNQKNYSDNQEKKR